MNIYSLCITLNVSLDKIKNNEYFDLFSKILKSKHLDYMSRVLHMHYNQIPIQKNLKISSRKKKIEISFI